MKKNKSLEESLRKLEYFDDELIIRKVNQIPEISKHSNSNDYWILFQYGGIIFDGATETFQREVFLINIPRANYWRFHQWNFGRWIKLTIREEKTCVLGVGAIFDCNGYKINDPLQNIWNSPNIITEKIILSNTYNYHKVGINNFYANTPLSSIEFQFDSVTPYYFFEAKNKKKFFIPISVISKYFFYHNIKTTHSIINNKLKRGIQDVYTLGEQIIVPVNTKVFDAQDAILLSQYLFIEGEKNGLTSLSNSISEFWETMFNQIKLNNLKYNHINYKIPFNIPLGVEVICQCLGEDKYLVYDIKQIKPNNNNYSLILDKAYSIFIIDDNRSTDQRNKKPVKKKKGVKENENVEDEKNGYDDNGKEVSDYIDKNSLTSKKEVEVQSLFFNGNPKVTVHNKEDQKHKHIMDGLINAGWKNLTFEPSKSNGNSDSKQADIKKTQFNSKELFKIALEEIKKTQYCELDFLTVFESTEKIISTYIFEEVEYKLLIGYLKKDKEYILIESGPGYYIGVIENIGLPIEVKNDQRIEGLIRQLINKDKLQWSKAYYNPKTVHNLKKEYSDKIKSQYQFKILQPIKHLSETKEQNVIDRLVKRITSSII
jgi:hypothetical protein